MEQDSIIDLIEATDFQISLALSPDIYSWFFSLLDGC
jgi:hypothetical protein